MGKTGGAGRGGRLPIAAPTRIPPGEKWRFAGTPEEHQALMQNVIVEDEIRYRERFGRGPVTVDGYAVVRRGDPEYMTMYLSRESSVITGRHELGHLVQTSMSPSDRAGFRAAYDADWAPVRRRFLDTGGDAGNARAFEIYAGIHFYSGYGAKNPQEGFATAYNSWYDPGWQGKLNRGRIREHAPNVAAWMDENMP